MPCLPSLTNMDAHHATRDRNVVHPDAVTASHTLLVLPQHQKSHLLFIGIVEPKWLGIVEPKWLQKNRLFARLSVETSSITEPCAI